MPIRTVSNTGGNFNVAATWVGGIIPTNVDTIAFTVTSGPLTLDDNSPIRGINFTNYTNVFTIPNGSSYGLFFEDNGVTPAFVNLGTGGYTFVDGGANNGFDVSNCNVNPIFTSTGISFPFLLNSSFFISGLYINLIGTWLQSGVIANNTLFLNGGTFTHTGSLIDVTPPYYFDISVIGGAAFNLTTALDLDIYANSDFTGTINIVAGNIPNLSIQNLNIANVTCGNVGILDSVALSSNITCGDITTSLSVAYSVNLLGISILPIPILYILYQTVGVPRTDNINLGTYTVDIVYYNLQGTVASGDVNINLLSVLNCNKIYIRKPFTVLSRFSGAFGFVCNEFIMDGTQVGAITFESGISYYINNVVNIIAPTTILSSTPGVKANLILGQNINQNTISYLTATDINSNGGRRMNNFYGTVTNCDNIRVWNDNTLPQAPSTF